MSYILFAFLLICSAHASLQKIQIKNLDLSYTYPYGAGQMEKLSLGINTNKALPTYPLEIFRREKTMEINSPFVDFEWLDPLTFVMNMQTATIEKLNMDLNFKASSVTAQTLKVALHPEKEFIFTQFSLNCQGPSTQGDPIARLKEDCLESLTAKATQMELPFEVVKSISAELPDEPTELDLDMPANDFSLSIDKGDFSSYVRIKYVFRAYLKLWGHMQYEEGGKVLAVRVDSVKFGILPVTTLVMNQLRRQVHSPKVTIDPPWIRIKIGKQ